MQTFLKLTWTELKLGLREPAAIFFTLAFPVLIMVLFGAIYGNAPEAFYNGYGSVDVSVPGYIGMIIGTIGMIGLPVTLANYRDKGILRRFQTTPMQPSAILSSQVAANVVMQLLGIALLFLVGIFFFDLRFPSATFAILPAVLIGGFSFFAIGFVLAGVLPTARSAQAVGMALFYPMLFLSGAAMPRQIMPEGVQQFAEWLPLTHVVILIEDLWFHGTWNLSSLLVIVALLIISLAVTRYTFRWD